jgi:hypothetical protein
LPPLSVCTPPGRRSHAKTCHPERSEGSAFPSICPLLSTDFRISNSAFLFPLATLTGAVSPATHYPLLATHFLNTQDLPQTFSHHALAHNLRDTPRWGASLATNPSPLATVPLFSYSYALFCTAQIAISHPFNAFRTLCAKHPGWRGVSLVILPSEARTSAPPRPPREKNLLLSRHLSTTPLRPGAIPAQRKSRDSKAFSLPSTFNFRRSTVLIRPPTERSLHRR